MKKGLNKIVKITLFSLISVLLPYLIIKYILLSINEPINDLNIIYFFFLPFCCYTFLFLIKKIKWLKKNFKKYTYTILFSILCLIINYFLLKNSTVLSIINISIFISIWFYYYTSHKTNFKIINTINFFLYFLITYLSILYLLLISINFTIDEGFILLIALLFFIYSFSLWCSLAFTNREKKCIDKFNKKFIILTILILVLETLFISFLYWNILRNLSFSNFNKNVSINEIFDCTYTNEINTKTDSIVKKDDIIKYLEKDANKEIDKIAVLYLLSDNIEWGKKFKEELINESNDNKFLNAGGSVKAWQYDVAVRGYYFIKINEKNPELFSVDEKNKIIKWFKKINDHAYKITLADIAYSSLFMKKPTGLYLNQEIGAGFLAVISEILKESYPEDSKKNLTFIKKNAIGWNNNFRNTDDGIVYHQSTWIKNAYLLSLYGNIGNPKSNLSRMSFNWIYHQTPLNGKLPKYNTLSQHSAADVMTLGTFIFKDSRYKYIAEKMLLQDIQSNNEIDNAMGLEMWDDNIIPIESTTDKSCIMYGTTGLNFNPKKIKYDKLEFRKTINNKELFILINLRSSGWHKYNSTGSIIMVSYGDDILIQDNIKNTNHSWLPKGKAQHRDKKITIEEITNYKNYSKGIAKVFYKLTNVPILKNLIYKPFVEDVKINEKGFEITFYSQNNQKINLIGTLENNELHIYYVSKKNMQKVIKIKLN